MMDFESADVDSTKPSRSRDHRGRTDRRWVTQVESFDDRNVIDRKEEKV